MKVTKEQFIGVTYEELLAENAALQEECDGWKKLCVDQEVMHVMHEDALDNENAKLRELVRDMCVWAYIDSDCDLEDRFANRMRELGIEAG